MPSEKRQRQDQGRLLRLEEERQAKKKSSRLSGARLVILLVVGVLAVGAIIAFLPGKDDDKEDAASDSTTTSTTATGEAVKVTVPKAGASVSGATTCPPADGSAERTTTFAQAPPTCIDASKTYTAVMKTSEGDITIALDDTAAPITVNNFVVLSRYHYYDGVAFHRIIPGFMDQAGDANGPEPGQGGPGYSIMDELPTGATPYAAGTLAMANKGSTDTGGSQFFLVVGSGGEQLAPTYTVFGKVTKGQDVVDTINGFGTDDSTGAPTKVVTIDSVTISES